MAVFRLVVVAGLLLLAAEMRLASAATSSRRAVDSVAYEWRHLLLPPSMCATFALILGGTGWYHFRNPAKRKRPHRAVYIGFQFAATWVVLWGSLPIYGALAYYRELYCPIGAGGAANPIPRAIFDTVCWAWGIGGWLPLGVGLVFIWRFGADFKHREAAVENGQACPHCEYDLTGNRSGICPECGTPVTPEATDSNQEHTQSAKRP